MIYTISDEIHQLFVLGRGGQIKDVIIDSSGAVVGIGGYKFFKNVRENAKSSELI